MPHRKHLWQLQNAFAGHCNACLSILYK